MTTRSIAFRNLTGSLLAASALLVSTPASAQPPAPAPAAPAAALDPALSVLPPVPRTYVPKKTSWGDPDLRGMWPIDSLGGLNMQRSPAQGNRVFLTEQEYQARESQMQRSREAADRETKANKLGMGNWVEMTGAGRRTSILIDPPNGRLPDLTDEGLRRSALMRSSWIPGQTYDWVDDFDTWDHCTTRGFPASMYPFRYNNGIQILQGPGYVVINLEMIHDARIIPIGTKDKWPKAVTSWFGQSIGHWEGNTLVVETTNIRPGASALNMATIGVPPDNTLPMSDQAKTVERFTMVGPDEIVHELTYTDPVIWKASFTTRMNWQRNEKYEFFEYACHEGDIQVRNYIKASRSQREKDRAAEKAAAAGAPVAPAGQQ
jgi:hypothetical protein